MTRLNLRWLVPLVLAGTFMAAPAVNAQGRLDRHQDRRQLRQQRRQIQRTRQRLHAKVQRFGPRSVQARAARRHLRKVQRRYVRQRRDLHRDRQQARRRRWVTRHSG